MAKNSEARTLLLRLEEELIQLKDSRVLLECLELLIDKIPPRDDNLINECLYLLALYRSEIKNPIDNSTNYLAELRSLLYPRS